MEEGKGGDSLYIPKELNARPYRIGILSTHGSGKTGLIDRVKADFHALKLGGLIGVVAEISSDFWMQGYPINRDTSVAAQIAILTSQINQEQKMMLRGAYPIILTDRTVLDNLVYYMRVCDNIGGTEGRNYKKYGVDMVMGYIEHFPYDILYRVPMTEKPQETPIRDGNEAFQVDIDQRLTNFIKEWSIPCIELPPSTTPKRQDWADMIIHKTIEDLEKRGARIPK